MKQPFSLSQFIAGLIVIVLGLGFLFDNTNLFDFSAFIAVWWPLLLVVVGMVSYINNRHILFPLAAVLFGGLWQLENLKLIDFDAADVAWPALIVYVGVSLLLGARRIAPKVKENTDNLTSIFVLLSGVESKSKAEQYKGGRLSTILGGATIDLRDANIDGEAALDMLAVMGGAEIWVPKEWRVEVAGTQFLGGWEDKTVKPHGANAPILRINATCVMGGLEIKN